ncbi:MAG: His/Gly/Thr/Pro-type tRNA ligase C-terminal domain-containing protein, partial [Planctomycetota bacterium]|nr:His/Gly/Thr/Pro-type tRNA ligase C-terminal domain-containing protein [Planctomycetota bacterium]
PAATPREPNVPIFVAPVTDGERMAAFQLVDTLRAAGLRADTDFEGKSLRALFKAADKRGVELMLVLGPEEAAAGRVKLKDLRRGEELELPTDGALADVLRQRLEATEP